MVGSANLDVPYIFSGESDHDANIATVLVVSRLAPTEIVLVATKSLESERHTCLTLGSTMNVQRPHVNRVPGDSPQVFSGMHAILQGNIVPKRMSEQTV